MLKNFEPTLTNVLYYSANCHGCKWPNIAKVI